MKLKTIKTYKFEELSEKVQERLINSSLDFGYEILGSDFSYDAKEIIKEKLGIEELDLYYSLGYCQGDGVSFEGRYIRIEKLLENFRDQFSKREIRILNVLGNNIYVDAVRNNSRYCHSNTMSIEISNISDYYDYDIIQDTLHSIQDTLTKIARDICDELEELGYRYFDGVNDYLKNDYIERDEDYTENGDLV